MTSPMISWSAPNDTNNPDAYSPDKQAGRAIAGINAIGPNQLDAHDLSSQQQALSQLGQQAFTTSPSLGERQTGAAAGQYDAAAGAEQQAAHAGTSPGQQLTHQLGVQGQAQQGAAGAANQLGQEESKRRLGAQILYGGQGGTQREQADQNAQFNATEAGGATQAIYNSMTGADRTAAAAQQAATGNAVQGGISAGMAALSLLALL